MHFGPTHGQRRRQRRWGQITSHGQCMSGILMNLSWIELDDQCISTTFFSFMHPLLNYLHSGHYREEPLTLQKLCMYIHTHKATGEEASQDFLVYVIIKLTHFYRHRDTCPSNPINCNKINKITLPLHDPASSSKLSTHSKNILKTTKYAVVAVKWYRST